MHLITSQSRVKSVSQLHQWNIHRRMVGWCIRKIRLVLMCEMIRYRLVQFQQNLDKTFPAGPQSPFSISSSSALFLAILPFNQNKKPKLKWMLHYCQAKSQKMTVTTWPRLPDFFVKLTFLRGDFKRCIDSWMTISDSACLDQHTIVADRREVIEYCPLWLILVVQANRNDPRVHFIADCDTKDLRSLYSDFVFSEETMTKLRSWWLPLKPHCEVLYKYRWGSIGRCLGG